MLIDIKKVNLVPNATKLEVCIYGELSGNKEVREWVEFHNLRTYNSQSFTNIDISEKNLSDLFVPFVPFEYMDGFSPNLNKYLHIGHFSNLVLSKAYKALGVAKKTVSIYGDTLKGDVEKTDALGKLFLYYAMFETGADKIFFASEMMCNPSLLVDGTDTFEGTKCFHIGEEKIVGIKSDGSTSYFYQDVALATELKSRTLYLTGKEQNNHFNTLKVMFPLTQHIGLGLVRYKAAEKEDSEEKEVAQKMSSRLGNVIYMEDFIKEAESHFVDRFDDNQSLMLKHLVYNIFAGHILKSAPEVDKTITEESLSNRKTSLGLYLSYTTARMHSAGCVDNAVSNFSDKLLEYGYLRAKVAMKPNLLFDELVKLANRINKKYETDYIKDNPTVKAEFETMYSDLVLGMRCLGMFPVERV